MHFPPVLDFPLFSKNFRTLRNIFAILLFPDKFLDFHPPKFLMTFFLVIDHKFPISPLFSLFQYISLLFRGNYFSLYFDKFPLCFRQIHLLFYMLYVYFERFPLLLTMMHLCMMHHPMHVLDAPVVGLHFRPCTAVYM